MEDDKFIPDAPLHEEDVQLLVRDAFAAAAASYSPYSEYRVGAALLTGSGKVFTGCNVENASYPVGICAERTAAAKAVSEGETVFEAIAIVGYLASEGPEAGEEAYPCGFCRQFLNEFASAEMMVYIAQSEDKIEALTLAELLPYDFGPAKLLRGENNG